MRRFLMISFISLLHFSCSNEKQYENEIPIDKMKVVIWQLMKADELYTRKSVADSTWKVNKKNVEFYHQIFELNKVDRVQFYKQMDEMKAHPAEFKELMDSVNELSKREKNRSIEGIKKI
jgi:hypothetical protein